jgi:hypothetical protein
MSLFSQTLVLKAIDGHAPGCKILSVAGLSSTYVFLKIVETLKGRFGASVEKEAGSALSGEWLIQLRTEGHIVSVSWEWHGIYISVEENTAWELLERIAEKLSHLKLNKLRLFVEEKLG